MFLWSLALAALLTTADDRIQASPFQVDDGTLLVAWNDSATPHRIFYANGSKRGKTNTNTKMSAGTYSITLGEPHDYTPAKIVVTVEEGKFASVTFTKVATVTSVAAR